MLGRVMIIKIRSRSCRERLIKPRWVLRKCSLSISLRPECYWHPSFIDEGAEVIYSTASRKEVAEPRLGPRAPALNHYAALSSCLCAIPSCSEKLTCDTVAARGGWAKGPPWPVWVGTSGCCWRRSKPQSAFAQRAWSMG